MIAMLMKIQFQMKKNDCFVAVEGKLKVQYERIL